MKELEYQYGLLQIEEQIEDECLEFEKLEYLGFWNTLQNEIKMWALTDKFKQNLVFIV